MVQTQIHQHIQYLNYRLIQINNQSPFHPVNQQQMSDGNMVYLGLCVRYQPPIIGVHYKNKQTDQKKKVYTIVLQRLIFNPNPMQVTEQLYQEHPHILKETKIPKEKIAILVEKIQRQLRIGEEYDQQEEHEEEYEEDYQQEEQNEGQDGQEEEEQHYEEPKKQPEQPQQVPQKKRPKFDFDKDFGRDDGPLNRSM